MTSFYTVLYCLNVLQQTCISFTIRKKVNIYFEKKLMIKLKLTSPLIFSTMLIYTDECFTFILGDR